MDQLLSFTIIGLSTAAIYAVGASGLVLTYTTTGIFNFAHGAIGMFGAFAYWQLRFDWGWPAPLALVVVLFVLAPAFGVFLEVAIMRNLQGTTETTRLVVSISLLAGLVGLANWIWEPGIARPMSVFFRGERFELGPTFVSWHEATTVLVAIGVAIGLRFLLFRTRAGIAMRAAVDDRPLSTLNGARPDRVSMLAWAIGCSLATLSGILIAPALALDPGVLSLLIVNTYAAAMIGRLCDLPLTFLGAIMLGLAEAYARGYLPDSQYLASFPAAVPVLILFVVLLVLPNPRLRGRTGRNREWFPMPSWPGALKFAAVVATGAVVVSGLLTKSNQQSASLVFAFGIMALSLVPLVGFAGQISLCQLSFAGIGAVVMAHLGDGGNVLGLVLAMTVAGAVGALIALPALRLSGIYLALATAAFAVALDRWFFLLPEFDIAGVEINLFQQGSVSVDRLKLFGYQFTSPRAQMILLGVVFALVSLFVVWIRRGRLGQRLLAMKDSEAACATLGLNLTGTKLVVFTMSAAIAGLGGALYGGLVVSINPQTFSFINGLPVLMLTVVGGIGAVGGALFAGISLALLPFLPTVLPWTQNILLVTPGLIGISLGRNPNGAVAEINAAFEPLKRSTATQVGLLAVLAGLYVLNQLDVIGNWPLAILALVALLAAPTIAERVAPPLPAGVPELEPAPSELATAGDGAALEWVGITRPYTDADRRALDTALGTSELELHGAP